MLKRFACVKKVTWEIRIALADVAIISHPKVNRFINSRISKI